MTRRTEQQLDALFDLANTLGVAAKEAHTAGLDAYAVELRRWSWCSPDDRPAPPHQEPGRSWAWTSIPTTSPSPRSASRRGGVETRSALVLDAGNAGLLPDRFHDDAHEVFRRLIEVLEGRTVRLGTGMLFQVCHDIFDRRLQSIETIVHSSEILLGDDDLPGRQLE